MSDKWFYVMLSCLVLSIPIISIGDSISYAIKTKSAMENGYEQVIEDHKILWVKCEEKER